jgi:hypothetical protein
MFRPWGLVLEAEYWIRVLEYRELRKIFGFKGKEIREGGGTAQPNKFHKDTENLCSPFVTRDD